MRQRPTCDLCGETLDPARGVHTYQADTAVLDIHPECAMVVMNGVWDELEARHARGEYLGEPLEPPLETLIGTQAARPHPEEPMMTKSDIQEAFDRIDLDIEGIVERAMSGSGTVLKPEGQSPVRVRKAGEPMLLRKHGDTLLTKAAKNNCALCGMPVEDGRLAHRDCYRIKKEGLIQ